MRKQLIIYSIDVATSFSIIVAYSDGFKFLFES